MLVEGVVAPELIYLDKPLSEKACSPVSERHLALDWGRFKLGRVSHLAVCRR